MSTLPTVLRPARRLPSGGFVPGHQTADGTSGGTVALLTPVWW